MNIQNINFKKVFILFFATFLLFSAVSFAFAASSGGWSEAVQFEQSRLEARSQISVHEDWTRGGFGRPSHHARMAAFNLAASAEADTSETFSGMTTPTRGSDNRLLYGFARSYVRMTSVEFDAFHVIGLLFRAVFTLLLALWVYVDSKKRGGNAILWTAITVVISIFGLVVYLIVRQMGKTPTATV